MRSNKEEEGLTTEERESDGVEDAAAAVGTDGARWRPARQRLHCRSPQIHRYMS